MKGEEGGRGKPTTMVMVEEKERRRVKAAGVQVILPEMFQRRVAGPEACFGHVICVGRLPDVGTFRVISLAPQPLSHAFSLSSQPPPSS